MTPHVDLNSHMFPPYARPLVPDGLFHKSQKNRCTKSGILLSYQAYIWNIDNINKMEVRGEKILSEI